MTLRAEEVDTVKARINIDHVESGRWPPLVDADWHAFCQAIYKGIGGSERSELYEHYREMSKATGAKKPCESQRARALLGNEGEVKKRKPFGQ